ncbi:MAG TPA: exo-beta-N-acetylmuramidase NamZ domain-containing protein [Thermoanaerobaculia bacterium]
MPVRNAKTRVVTLPLFNFQFSIFNFLLLLTLAACATSTAPSPFSAEGLANVDRVIESAIEAGRTPGGVVHVERRGGIYARAYGQRSIVPVEAPASVDTIYDVASITKVIATAPSIYLLQERGALSIDDPVSRHLPAFIGDGREAITIRHLLTHTSGLRPGLPLSPAWSGYAHGIGLALAEIPVTKAGYVFRYSDINYILLGEVVRQVSGESLDQFATRVIFQPLRMRDTRFLPDPSWRGRIAPTQQAEERMLHGEVHDPTARRMGGVAGHAGLFSTAADLARFARMLLAGGTLDGVRVFAPDTVRLMTSVQTPEGVAVRRAGGFDLDSNYSRPRGAYFPLGSFGHTGWTGGFFWVDPVSETFYVFLSNRVHPDGTGGVVSLQQELGTAVAEAVSGFDFRAVAPRISPRPGNLGTATAGDTQNGIDVLSAAGFEALRGLRVGLVTNHTGIDSYGNPTIDLLRAAREVELVALFSPEHGIRGLLDDKVDDSVDSISGLPIYSLYGERRKPALEQLQGLDALVFDIQDIGTRFYTYISTMGLAMEAAGEAGIRFIVLDRVNPIGGQKVEGPIRAGESMFTAWHPIVVRHGMTIGELARMYRAERSIEVELEVIALRNWSRDLWFDRSGQRWINPSPNMRSLAQATLYPGVGLLEATEVSVGRGTATPFELFGAPYIEGAVLARELGALAIAGIDLAPVVFTPDASVFAGQRCEGVRLTVTDREAFHAVEAGVTFASVLHRLYPSHFTVEKVDRLLRHPATIDAIREGKGLDEIRELWRPEIEEFAARRQRYLLY